MADDVPPTLHARSWRIGLSRLRRRVDWIMLFPACAAVAWVIGEDAVAIALVFVFPVLVALQGPRRNVGGQEVTLNDISNGRPLPRADLHRLIDQVLEDCAKRDRTTAVLQVQIEDLHVADGEWGTELSDIVMDRVIQRIAATLRGQDSVVRSGDGCLTIVLTPTRRADLAVVMNIVDRVQTAVGEPISINGRSVRVRSSVGICSEAMAPSRSGAALLAAADCALRVALRQEGDTVRAFNADLQTQVETDHKLSSQVEDALDAGDIRPWFQPQVNAVTGHLAGFEALARWHHPELGVLHPAQFLSAVHSAGRIADLGELMLQSSLAALSHWDAIGLKVPHVGVNVSLEELCDPRLGDRLIWQVDRHELTPNRIAIEILETVTLREHDETIVRNINQLRGAGFLLDLDDFGTGAASIAHIARFGVHRIKLDRSFVQDIDHDSDQRRIVRAILSLARNLEIDTLAEGVETPGERDTLTQLGCPQLQGFVIAHPMPLSDATAWALARQAGEAQSLRAMQPQGRA